MVTTEQINQDKTAREALRTCLPARLSLLMCARLIRMYWNVAIYNYVTIGVSPMPHPVVFDEHCAPCTCR